MDISGLRLVTEERVCRGRTRLAGDSARRRGRLGNAGLTVLELVIVLTVIGLLVALSLPRAGTAIEHARVNRAALVVAVDLRLAYSLAQRRRRPVRVASSDSLKAYRFTDDRLGTEYYRRVLGPGTAFRLSGLEFDPPAVVIAPMGVASSALKVSVTAGGYTRVVTMMRSGIVRVVPL